MSDPRCIESSGISEAWVAAVRTLLGSKRRDAFQFFVRMRNPLPESPEVHRVADELLTTLGYRSVETVRNTIFPYDWANDIPDPEMLSIDYLDHYADLKGLENPRGTYFGRMIAYPRDDGETGNQLLGTIEKLQGIAAGADRYKCRYEINIHNESRDSGVRRGFPCMSHLAFQLDGQRLHCFATYRNHDLIEKSYGNWLGLAQLQQYVATTAELEAGELSILAGHAFMELSSKHRAQLAQRLEEAAEAASIR